MNGQPEILEHKNYDVIIMFFAEVFTPSVIVVVEKRHSNVPSLNKFIISFCMYLGIRL